jgi:hypothetical protein
MVASVHSGGTTHTLAAVSFRDADNILRRVAVGKIRNAANVLKLFIGSLTASLSRDTVFGKVNTSLSVPIQTQSVQAIPDGGAEPDSYLWVQTGGSGTWTINSPVSDMTVFTGGNCGPGEVLSATFHCTVTDAAGNSVTTSNVTATVSNIGATFGEGPLP